MTLRVFLLAEILAFGTAASPPPARVTSQAVTSVLDCPGMRPRAMLGLVARTLTLSEMVNELERGCLALDDVRFIPGQDTIESLSPAQFALVARALGMAHGAYQIMVPAEASPGGRPDTLQARRRGTRLRDELVHYGASSSRLLEDPRGLFPTVVVASGAAVPMLVRVPDKPDK
ncbi:MAG TPA: hypothetical protein VFU23_16545 [Gemmatimonadales bacterium]|nr:hypothetical protein [Gemmatimonadales bacterium]